MKRFAILMYDIVSYLIGVVGLLAIIFHMVGLLQFQPGPFQLESVPAKIAVGIALMSLFGVQHTVMARRSFKEAWTKIIPEAAERSTFVLITGIISVLMVWLWPHMDQLVWNVSSPALAAIITSVGVGGWLYLFLSTFAINHFELFGLQQVFNYFAGKEPKPLSFKEQFMYRFDRHPIMTGALIGFWAAPTMTLDHLLFSLLFTVYVIIGVSVEENSLLASLKEYSAYKARVRTIVPTFRFRKKQMQ